jgi:predicted lipoprotein with Yx(FWY)xxD motif
MRIRLPLVGAALTLTLAACGSASSSAKDDPVSSDGSTARTDTARASAAARARGPKLRVMDSDFGRILADGHGRALYLFTADDRKDSNCSGDCATAWPPYIVKRKPFALAGAKPGLVGTTRRGDGKLQATYAGHPVYYYVGDRSPGEVNCQAAFEFGGYWYVVRGNGRAVR